MFKDYLKFSALLEKYRSFFWLFSTRLTKLLLVYSVALREIVILFGIVETQNTDNFRKVSLMPIFLVCVVIVTNNLNFL